MFSTWFTGRALHAGFLAKEASADTTGTLFEPARDGAAVSGGWRAQPESGGAPLAALTALAALPLEMGTLSLRMADLI